MKPLLLLIGHLIACSVRIAMERHSACAPSMNKYMRMAYSLFTLETSAIRALTTFEYNEKMFAKKVTWFYSVIFIQTQSLHNLIMAFRGIYILIYTCTLV